LPLAENPLADNPMKKNEPDEDDAEQRVRKRAKGEPHDVASERRESARRAN
jgi:hypothetical protein